MKHTPLPWFVDEGTPGHIKSKSETHRFIDGVGRATPTVAKFDTWSCLGKAIPDGVGFSKEDEQANAAFIVRACNSFYPMLDALNQVWAQINWHAGNQELCDVVRAAIAKATPNTEEAKGER